MESLQYLFLNAANQKKKNGANSECIATIKPYMHPIKISFSAQGLEKNYRYIKVHNLNLLFHFVFVILPRTVRNGQTWPYPRQHLAFLILLNLLALCDSQSQANSKLKLQLLLLELKYTLATVLFAAFQWNFRSENKINWKSRPFARCIWFVRQTMSMDVYESLLYSIHNAHFFLFFDSQFVLLNSIITVVIIFFQFCSQTNPFASMSFGCGLSHMYRKKSSYLKSTRPVSHSKIKCFAR